MSTKTDIVVELESMVDTHGLLYVVQALELMCHEKAEHLRVNWQDNATAKAWDKAAKACYKAAQVAAIVS